MNASKTLFTKGGLTLGAVAILATAGAASASAATVPAAHHVYPLKAVTDLYNRPDSGGVGNWANDALTRTVTFREIGASAGVYTYVATLGDRGEFTTISGAYTPNQGGIYAGDKISGQVSGSMNGSTSFEFTATNPIDNHARNLGVPATLFGAVGSTLDLVRAGIPRGDYVRRARHRQLGLELQGRGDRVQVRQGRGHEERQAGSQPEDPQAGVQDRQGLLRPERALG